MKATLLILLFLPFGLCAQIAKSYPPQVEAVLKKAGKNRPELEKALDYFSDKGDPLKAKAIQFLVSNMDIHYSEDYYWADSTGKCLVYNELDYPDFASAVEAFEKIKVTVGKLKPQPFKYNDIDTITAGYLIENVELAFREWNKNDRKKVPFEDFCEYILPYRVSTEPLQNWRNVYQHKFSWLNDSAKTENMENVLLDMAADLKTWFINTWDIEVRKEPLPRLGALQLLSRKKGNCDDIGNLEVFSLRSQGRPASLEYVPFWATSSGMHFFNSTIDENLKPLPFDVSTATIKINSFSREPSKVLRITYSKQPNALAFSVPETDIPPGFLRLQNYKDVTAEYWQTGDVSMPVNALAQKLPVVYACVFNGFGWKPTWWGRPVNNTVTFHDMCKGAVFLPMCYIGGTLVAAGDPVASGYEHQQVLKPNLLATRAIVLKEQDKYLIYRPGKNYKLYYWDKKWVLLGQKKIEEGCHELTFDAAPKDALFLLVPEYSQGKERPFMITDEGERLWW